VPAAYGPSAGPRTGRDVVGRLGARPRVFFPPFGTAGLITAGGRGFVLRGVSFLTGGGEGDFDSMRAILGPPGTSGVPRLGSKSGRETKDRKKNPASPGPGPSSRGISQRFRPRRALLDFFGRRVGFLAGAGGSLYPGGRPAEVSPPSSAPRQGRGASGDRTKKKFRPRGAQGQGATGPDERHERGKARPAWIRPSSSWTR